MEEYMSEEIGEIAGALSKAQGAFKPIERKCTNPFYKSKYADLAAIRDGTQEALCVNDLAVSQVIVPDPDLAIVESRLLHKSGQWITSTAKLRPTATNPQSMGSAITYARRYSLSALLNIATEDEDDGNSASDAKPREAKKPLPNVPIKGKDEPQRPKEAPEYREQNPPVEEEVDTTTLEETEAPQESTPSDVKPIIDVGWFDEKVAQFQRAGLKKWSNAMVIKSLNALTGRNDKMIHAALGYLTPEQAEAITISILETEKML